MTAKDEVPSRPRSIASFRSLSLHSLGTARPEAQDTPAYQMCGI